MDPGTRMQIVRLKYDETGIIRPLWEKLNALHEQRSTHFKNHFHSFTFEQRCRQLEQKDHTAFFVAREGKALAGYCIASVNGKQGEIDSIYLIEEYRGLGVGEQLIAAGESWLRSKGVSKISVAVIEGNESSFGFYTRKEYRHRFTIFEKQV